jgi:four helix bundle protein
MENPVVTKKFDLRDRTLKFSQNIRKYVRTIELNEYNSDDVKQLIRSSGSIGANYIEAEDAISGKDFVHRIKISRKEAKESIYWLRLLPSDGENSTPSLNYLIDEAAQLMKIFGKIITDIEQRPKR